MCTVAFGALEILYLAPSASMTNVSAKLADSFVLELSLDLLEERELLLVIGILKLGTVHQPLRRQVVEGVPILFTDRTFVFGLKSSCNRIACSLCGRTVSCFVSNLQTGSADNVIFGLVVISEIQTLIGILHDMYGESCFIELF